MLKNFLFLAFLHLSSALFETCDEIYKLETREKITINSKETLNSKNASSCRFSIVAPVNYVVDVTCTLKIDQLDSKKCPFKRFFVSDDGIRSLRGADYFCSTNGTSKTVKRKSIMNRLVLAYAATMEMEGDEFTCVLKRIPSECDCGWSKKVRFGFFIVCF